MEKRQYDIQVAVEVGTMAATFLDSIRRWIEYNAANKKNYHNGRYWTYNSRRAWANMFPEYSEDQIKRGIKKLKDSELLITDNFNKSAMDQTLWYALTDKAVKLLYYDGKFPYDEKGERICPFGQMDWANSPSALGEMTRPIPSIKPSNKPIIMMPPTLEDVVAYAESRKSMVDPKFFYDYFNTNEWVDSKGNPVKNWKNKFITWEKNKLGLKDKPTSTPGSVDLSGYDIEGTMANTSCLLDDLLGNNDER